MFTPPDTLFRTGRPLVVFVVPEAFTPVCTRTIRAAAALDAAVPLAVMSTDNQAALDEWLRRERVGNVQAVADNEREFILHPHRGTYAYDERRELLGVIYTEDVSRQFAALTMLLPQLREAQLRKQAAPAPGPTAPAPLTGAAAENAARNGLVDAPPA